MTTNQKAILCGGASADNRRQTTWRDRQCCGLLLSVPLRGHHRAMTIIAAGLMFICTPTAVYDGDGPIWCEEGPRIRVAGIAAREMDGTCSLGHPCPDASALQARDALVKLLGGPWGTLLTGHVQVRAGAMRCRSTGGAGGNRTGAFCTLVDGRDLSCSMLATGTVAPWERFMWGRQCG